MTLTLKKIETDKYIDDIFELTKPISKFYPNFKNWLYKNFDAKNLNQERLIYGAFYNQELIGVCLGKRTQNENKICTIFVKDEFRYGSYENINIGTILFSKMIKEFEYNDEIEISFNDCISNNLKYFVEKFGFKYNYSIKNLYKENNIEHFYKRPFR